MTVAEQLDLFDESDETRSPATGYRLIYIADLRSDLHPL